MKATRILTYIEASAKRAFAGAIEWPGWCVSGRTPEAALQALFDSAPRYAAIVAGTGIGFETPGSIEALEVVERLQGNVTTDFGAPAIAPQADSRPLDAAGLRRQQTLLEAAWRALDEAAAAAGKELRKGPRGGGRDLDAIVRHVLESEAGYLGALGWKFKAGPSGDVVAEKAALRAAIHEGLAASVAGQIAAVGPRGRPRWSPRYFVRRAAWHAVEHAWEIKDRALP